MKKAQGTNINRVFGASLRRLLAERGIEQRKLADDLGCTPSTMSYWCSGRTTPSMQAVATIADYFSVSVATLFSGYTTASAPSVYRVKVPVDSQNGMTFVDEFQLSNAPNKKADFAILAPDDGMTPLIRRNDVILCCAASSAKNGELVVVDVGGMQAVRWFFEIDGMVTLATSNPSIAPITFKAAAAPSITGKPILIQRQI